jgi:hypothetical protein
MNKSKKKTVVENSQYVPNLLNAMCFFLSHQYSKD